MRIEISAVAREKQGTGASRRLRNTGRVPGILYGAGKDIVKVEFDHNNLYHQLKQEAFHSSILSLELAGNKEKVLLRDVQMHPFKLQVLHVDFQRVSENEKIHVKVPLHFINAEIAPGVKNDGGVISHVMTELNISCLPKDLPEFIEVDLSTLSLGHSIHVSEIKLPQGVTPVGLGKGDDPVVATVQIPKAMVSEESAAAPTTEEAAAAPAEGAAAPAAGKPGAAAAPAAKAGAAAPKAK